MCSRTGFSTSRTACSTDRRGFFSIAGLHRRPMRSLRRPGDGRAAPGRCRSQMACRARETSSTRRSRNANYTWPDSPPRASRTMRSLNALVVSVRTVESHLYRAFDKARRHQPQRARSRIHRRPRRPAGPALTVKPRVAGRRGSASASRLAPGMPESRAAGVTQATASTTAAHVGAEMSYADSRSDRYAAAHVVSPEHNRRVCVTAARYFAC